MNSLLTLLPLLPLAGAQLLTNGNSQLPACASNCELLNQAAQACSGTTTADQATWSCFCQSAYLTSLYTSPNGVCDSVCTSAADNEQVQTWYTSNCGTDDGAAEHAGTTAATSSSATSSSATATVGTTGSAALPSTTASGGDEGSDTANTHSGNETWWDVHKKWIIMVIVIFLGLLLIGLGAGYLKHRHDRRADQPRSGFNAGITSRAPRPHHTGDSSFFAAADTTQMSSVGGRGRDSPMRTREAFMPYGYAYTRSESRLAERDERPSPIPTRGGTPTGELEKWVDKPGPRRVVVRERSLLGPESPGEGRGGR